MNRRSFLGWLTAMLGMTTVTPRFEKLSPVKAALPVDWSRTYTYKIVTMTWDSLWITPQPGATRRIESYTVRPAP